MTDIAVIFDVDGVLVDSYWPHLRSWQRLGAEVGFEMPEERFAVTFGRTSREILSEVLGVEADADRVAKLDARKEILYREIIQESFPAMDGAVELIDALRGAGAPLAAGSSGPPENVYLSVDRLGRREAFGTCVTGRDVRRSKPDPQVFLIAAERLGVEPGRCVVIEDAAAGVEAANRAGMASVGLTGTADRETLRAARLVVDSLRELSAERLRRVVHERRA